MGFWHCLNPLSTGKSVQTDEPVDLDWSHIVLIPYLQGSLFRPKSTQQSDGNIRLNPLSTGKSVQTVKAIEIYNNGQS